MDCRDFIDVEVEKIKDELMGQGKRVPSNATLRNVVKWQLQKEERERRIEAKLQDAADREVTKKVVTQVAGNFSNNPFKNLKV